MNAKFVEKKKEEEKSSSFWYVTIVLFLEVFLGPCVLCGLSNSADIHSDTS